jgi:hypothetical protein
VGHAGEYRTHMAQKSPDTSAIPLCPRHHRTGRDSYHKLGDRAFERHHGLDLRAVEAHLNTKACIRIEFRSFVAHYLGDQYVLGPVSIGVRSAVRQALISNGKIGPGYLWKQLPNLMSDRFCAFVSVYKHGFEVHRGFLAVGPPMETITSSPKLFTGFSEIWRHEAGSAKAYRIYAALVCQFHFGRTGASPLVTSPRPD